MNTCCRSFILSRWLIISLAVTLTFLPLATSRIPTVLRVDAATDSTITLNPGTLSYTISPDYLGFSIETANACNIPVFDLQKPAFAQLFKTLGTGNMRFGGTTVENTSWSPNGATSCSYNNTVVTKALIDSIFAFARKVNWKVMWTVALKHFDLVQFPQEAVYAVTSGGPTLSAIEFGNEPDLYNISYAAYKSNWEAYYNIFHALAPNALVSGPSLATPEWLASMLQDEGSKLSIATAHWYRGPAGGPHPPTIAKLLNPLTIQAAEKQINSDFLLAQGQHLPLQINETSNYYHQGQPGVSDVFASALWGLDYMFAAAEYGVTHIDFHGVPNTINGNYKGLPNYISPINSDSMPTPLYYGMLLFHYAAANGQIVPVQITSPANLSAHAVLGSDGKLRLVILNKDDTKNVTVNIDTTQSYTNASFIRLIAPGLNATTGITLGGSTVNVDGTWSPTVIGIKQLPVNGAFSTVKVPAGSAVEITYS